MLWMIIFGIVALFIWACCTGNDSSPLNSPKKDDIDLYEYSNYLSEEKGFYVGEKSIPLMERMGYSKFPMVGMDHMALDDNYLGKFEGYASSSLLNKDKYEIWVNREEDEWVGNIPSGNKWLYELIEKEGGYVHCYGYIACRRIDRVTGYPESWYAEVCIETNKREVSIRNYESSKQDKFYKFTKGGLKKFLDLMQDQEDE